MIPCPLSLLKGAKILVQEPKLENQLIVLRLLQEPTVMTDADRAGE